MFTVIKSLDENIYMMRAALGPMVRPRREPEIVMGPVWLTRQPLGSTQVVSS